jgi:type IV secretion system protein VirB10
VARLIARIVCVAWAAAALAAFAAAGPQEAAPAAAPDTETTLRLTCAGMGFQNGYLDGYETGLNDRRYNRYSDFKTHPLYEKASRGYNEKWVYEMVYQMAFRNGFGRGYEDGYNGRPNLVVDRFAQLEEALQEAGAAAPRDRRPAGGPVVLPAGTSLLLVLNDYLTTRMNQRGDPFSAVVARDVFVGNALAIPEGSVIEGTVGQVTRPGKVSGRGEMTLKFERLKPKYGAEVTLSATLVGVGSDQGQIVNREGTYQGKDSAGRDAAVVAGGAGAGTVVGVIAGGGKGAAIGATIGGLIGLAGVLTTRGEDVELVKGTLLEIMLDQDLQLDTAPPPRP